MAGYSSQIPILVRLDPAGKRMPSNHALHAINKRIVDRLNQETAGLFQKCHAGSLDDVELAPDL
jgi:hypothetical protein